MNILALLAGATGDSKNGPLANLDKLIEEGRGKMQSYDDRLANLERAMVNANDLLLKQGQLLLQLNAQLEGLKK